MPIEDVEGLGNEATDASGSDVGGAEGLDGGAPAGADSGAVGDSDGAGGDGDAGGSESDGGGDGPARSMGPGDKISQAATAAYRKLTGTEQPRDKVGRFQKGPPAQKQPVIKDPNAQQNAQNVTAKQPGAVDADRVPDSWTADAKAMWNQVPPRLRQEINKREADYRNGHARLNQQIELVKPHVELANMLGQTATPYLHMFNNAGLDLGRGLQDSIHTMAILNFGNNEQKVGLLKRLVKAFNIDVSNKSTQNGNESTQNGNVQPAQAPLQIPQQQPQQFRDPRVDALVAERDQLRQRELATTIDKFVEDPKHEHFQLVYEDMARLVETGMAPDMDTAYDMAVNINPAARAAAAEKLQKENAAQAAAAAAEARRAVGVRTGGKPAGNAPQNTNTKQSRNDVITAGVRQFLQSTGRA